MSETWPTVSVVVPVLNGGPAVKRLAASLLAQQYPGESPEILFVDNGSTDDGFVPLREMPVTILREEKRGAPVARNAGARRARGEILLFTDHDCTAERRWLVRLAEAFRDPRVPAAAGETLASPGTTWAARYAAAIRHNSAAVSLERPVFPFAATANFAVRRSLFEALGGFDETLRFTDDADFSLRITRLTGESIRFVPNAVIFHEPRATALALFSRYREYGRGWAELVMKHGDELAWTPRLAWQANLDVLQALCRIPGGFVKWRFGHGEPMDFHYRWFEFLRRLAHRAGFVQEAAARGHLLW